MRVTIAQTRLFLSLLILPITVFAADGTEQANCDTLVAETGTACMDMISRGLDVSCNTYLGAVGMAMDQADGNLFDVGDANKDTANRFCATYVKKLRKDRKANNHTMLGKSEVGPECAALAERFDARCITGLGKEKLSGKCKNVARTFTMGATGSMARGQLCTVAGMQLPE